MNRRAQQWKNRHILLWLSLFGLVCWWRVSDYRRAFAVEFHPTSHRLFLPDFFQEWASARNCVYDLPIYTPHEITIERYLGLRRPPNDPSFNEFATHPPSAVLLGIPFSGLPFAYAFALWNALSLLFLTISAVLMIRGLALPIACWDLLPTVTLLLLCYPFWHQMMHGQLNLLLLLLLTGAWAADRSGRPYWAGGFVGLATAIKFFPGFLFFYFFLRRNWREAGAGLLALAAITVITVLLFGPETYRSYFGEVLPHLAKYGAVWQNLSLSGLWFKLFDVRNQLPPVELQPLAQSPALALLGIVCTLLGVSTTLAWFVPRMLTTRDTDLAFAVTMIGMLLVSPITWDHYLLLLALPVAVIWQRLPRGGVSREILILLLAVLWMPKKIVVEHGLILLDAAQSPNDPGQWLVTPVETLTAVSIPCYILTSLFLFGLLASRNKTPQENANTEEPATV